jgi:hypothetical protein
MNRRTFLTLPSLAAVALLPSSASASPQQPRDQFRRFSNIVLRVWSMHGWSGKTLMAYPFERDSCIAEKRYDHQIPIYQARLVDSDDIWGSKGWMFISISYKAFERMTNFQAYDWMRKGLKRFDPNQYRDNQWPAHWHEYGLKRS